MSKGGSIVRATDKIGLKQLFDDDSSTFTYLLWDKESKDCILVDPVDIQSDRDVAEVSELGLNLVYGVNTRKKDIIYNVRFLWSLLFLVGVVHIFFPSHCIFLPSQMLMRITLLEHTFSKKK